MKDASPTNAMRSVGWLASALGALVLVAGATPAAAQSGLGSVYVENWGYFQKNENGSNQWKYEPHLYVPYHFDNGVTFTQRVDVPMIYTNATGAGNPDGGYAFGIGDVFIEEIFKSPDVSPNLCLKGSVRFVFPTGKQTPFGSSQYQWAPMGGFIYTTPNVWYGVTLEPYVRYFSGFDPKYDNVKETRKLDLYPAAAIGLPGGWSLLLYPENPITYNVQSHTWFVPMDLMFSRKIDKTFEFSVGGAWKLGNPSGPSYRYIINAQLSVYF